jgi:N-methylhydantoinase A
LPNLRVAVDIGGTFTDICILDQDTGVIRIAKTSSTPDPIDGVMKGLDAGGVDLSDVVLFSHGTTVATNALITRRLPRTGMVCTQGFRDVIEIRRANKDDIWDIYKDVAPPYVPRRDRLTVAERVDAAGKVVTPLNEESAREVARILKKRGVAAVAVCFMNAYANGANEQRMKAVLAEALPGVPVSISSEILPEIFEHERFSTTVVNAALSPVLVDYTTRLGARLAEAGYKSDLLLLHTGGGVMTPRGVKEFAGRLAGSGIAAGAIASRHIAAQCGFPNSIGLDMGGTSTDISLVYQGQERITKEWFVEYGYPICFPSIEVLTIGAGGGSLAWIDGAGSLRNGPQSAGANPGPACYQRGNDQATNTDANVVLGRLGSELIGGAMTLDAGAAERSLEDLGSKVALDALDAAKAVIQVANANMADTVRLISIRRGYDPREFALVVFGGAGALHGADLARELSIPTVIVPPNPGITSALGCLLVDVRHDITEMYLAQVATVDPGAVEAEFQKLEDEARERLAAEDILPEQMSLERLIDMRYLGQWRSLAVPVSSPLDLEQAAATFHAEHLREYNFRRDDAPVEIYRLNVKAIGVTPKAELARREPTGLTPSPRSRRPVTFFDSDGPSDTPVYLRDDLPAGFAFEGPAIVEGFDSTVVVPPTWRAEVDEWLNIRMHDTEAAQ